jgi:hypothetical protein
MSPAEHNKLLEIVKEDICDSLGSFGDGNDDTMEALERIWTTVSNAIEGLKMPEGGA